MKTSKKLNAVILILVIVLITIISFFGVYDISQIYGDNLVKDYTVGMELKGKRIVRLKVDDTVNEVTYDSEGNEVETQEDEGEYTVVSEPVNATENLTKENYQKSKEIIEDRLKSMDANEYKIRFNEEDGTIEIEFIDEELTDYILESIKAQGDFRIIDDDTEETLIGREFVKDATVLYSSTDSSTTTVYLNIEFNKEGSDKLEEISNTYIQTTEQVVNDDGETEETTTEKKITVKVDDDEIISTYFSEPLTDGHIYISVGQATTDNDQLKKYALQASIYATIIGSDTIPIVYIVEQDNYIVSNIDETIIPTVAVVTLIIEAIVLIAIFKLKGIIASILQVGYIALLLLILKYTNVYITLEGVFAIAFASVINAVFIGRVFFGVNKNENVAKLINEKLVKFINISIPVLIVAIVFCFANLLEINSFGMVIFWGYVVLLLYNILFTKGILKNMLNK